MTKRAAIYVRVSSERQAEGVSPEAQETDCKVLCVQKGYTVVETYRDTEKYRVGKRMIEPSGSRADRPGLKAMLAAAHEDRFDVIVAWREDRLYRSYRPMLDVLDTLDATKIDIELVKESFDKRLAPVKAWAARMELDAKHDRFMMGVAGRLERGKAWNQAPPYGYSKGEDGQYIENPVESQWIKNLFCWYSEGASYKEIRQRFVMGGAPQRVENTRRPWPVALLCRYLKAERYWSGFDTVKWNGVTYQIPIPSLVSHEEVRRVQARQARYKKYPAGNVKHDALAAGIIYCAACEAAMMVKTSSNGYRRKKDGRKTIAVSYACCAWGNLTPSEGCVGRVSAKRIDEQIWAKFWTLLIEPDQFESAIQRHVQRLRLEEEVAEKDITRLEQELDELSMERQRVITWARKGMIGEDDMAQQLLVLDAQTKTLRRTMVDAKLSTGDRSTQLFQLAETFRGQTQKALDTINIAPQTEEQAKRQKEYKRQVIQRIVKRVWVHPDKTVTLELEFDFPQTVNINSRTMCYRYNDLHNFTIALTL